MAASLGESVYYRVPRRTWLNHSASEARMYKVLGRNIAECTSYACRGPGVVHPVNGTSKFSWKLPMSLLYARLSHPRRYSYKSNCPVSHKCTRNDDRRFACMPRRTAGPESHTMFLELKSHIPFSSPFGHHRTQRGTPNYWNASEFIGPNPEHALSTRLSASSAAIALHP